LIHSKLFYVSFWWNKSIVYDRERTSLTFFLIDSLYHTSTKQAIILYKTSIIICSPLLIGWKHILVQSPSPISSVKVIAWQTAWLNKECRDQVILLPGFDYTFFFYGLALLSSPTMTLSNFRFCFVEDCLALSSFGWLF